MKILLVIPTLKQGGAERVMSVLSNNWSKKGYEVHLILLKEENEIFYNISKEVYIHYLINNDNSFKKLEKFFLFYRMRKIILKIQPDSVLSFLTQYNILTIIATIRTNIPVFVSDRNNLKRKIPILYEFFRRYTYKYANGIIAQTELAKEILAKKTGNKNIKVIKNPLDFPFSFKNKKEKIILNMGRLVEEKGHKYLIESFSKIENNEWKLVILGEGELRTKIESQIKLLKLEKRVVLMGSVKDIGKWLSKSSIFAFTSISEGFPNSLVEAMSYGLPCVAFDCDAGPRDIIIHKINGFLIDLMDVDSFSEKLNELMNDELLREKISIEAKKIMKDLNSDIIAEKILNFCLNKSDENRYRCN